MPDTKPKLLDLFCGAGVLQYAYGYNNVLQLWEDGASAAAYSQILLSLLRQPGGLGGGEESQLPPLW